MICALKKPESCFNCPYEDCIDDCKRRRDPEKNKTQCRNYYQRHKEEIKARVKRNKIKKRIAERGFEMAIYI